MGDSNLGAYGCKYTGLVELLGSNAPDGKKEYQGICITKVGSFHRLEQQDILNISDSVDAVSEVLSHYDPHENLFASQD